MSKIVTYSAIIGEYDKGRKDIRVFKEQPTDKFILPVMNAKIYKILPHKFFNAKYSIWTDGNIFLKRKASKLIHEFLGEDYDIAVFRCPSHNCIYKSSDIVKTRLRAEFHNTLDEQLKNYRQEGLPENFGMGQCGMIIRRHCSIVEEFNEKWWSEICRYTNRDQISFPYVKWKLNHRIKIRFIDGDLESHPYFGYSKHIKSFSHAS